MKFWPFRKQQNPHASATPLAVTSAHSTPVKASTRWGNVGRWLLFTVVLGLVPFIIGGTIFYLFYKNFSHDEALFAHGELLIFCAVIQAEATSDLMLHKTARSLLKAPVLGASFITFGTACALFAIFIFTSFFDKTSKFDDHTTAVISYVYLGFILAEGCICKWVATR